MAGQRQDSLTDQLRDLAEYARKEGMYDAHDWLLSSVVTLRRAEAKCRCSATERGFDTNDCEVHN